MAFNEFEVQYAFVGYNLTPTSDAVVATGELIDGQGETHHYNFEYSTEEAFKEDYNSGAFEEYCVDEMTRNM